MSQVGLPATNPKPFVFVLMPFVSEFDDVYRLGIKPACERAGAYAERVDEQLFQESILQRIYNQIAKADLIVADMSGRNPNVFYETGYAHALGKPVILLTRNADDIPFDLKHYPHIIYGGRIVDLLAELEKRVRVIIERPAPNAPLVSPIEVRVNGRPIEQSTPIHAQVDDKRHFWLSIELHNSVRRFIAVVDGQVGVLAPTEMDCDPNFGQEIKIDDETILYLERKPFSILPGAWYSTWGSFTMPESLAGQPITRSFAIRVFTSAGFVDHPFQLMIDR